MIRSDATTALRRRRGRVAFGAVVGVVGILLVAFFRLQVLRSSGYVLRSEENRLRAITIPAARGAVYDRNGRLIAENVPGFSLSLLPAPEDSMAASLDRLVPYLGIGSAEREELLDRFRRHPQLPLLVRDDLEFGQLAAIQERRPHFRRTVIDMQPRRFYPAGRVVAHLIGYVGEISEEELQQPEFGGYDPGRMVGKRGIERQYEHRLAGTPGVRYVEVNARGAIVSEFGARPPVPPVPGEDLTLGLDLALQTYADSVFPEDMKGGVVALDPRTGEVLLLYSHPTYDPNLFIGGISQAAWSALRNDPDHPLLNRVSTASYPPGSTWKLVMATLGLRSGAVGIDTRMPSACRGALRYGVRAFHCWKREGHGPLDLAGAIKESCNVYFYQLGLRLGLDAIMDGAGSLGFDRPTGIDLPAERPGFVPGSREWYDEAYGPRGWTESVILNLSIGQGEVHQTLLRMVQFYAALAVGGSPVVPHLLRSERLAARRTDWELGLPDARRVELVQALATVVNEPGGTAYAHRLERWRLAGKTGTAQNVHGEPHSWFVGFGPVGDPRIVIAAIVEHGHPSNRTSLAVPLGSALIGRYLESLDPAPAPPPAIAGTRAAMTGASTTDGAADAAPAGDGTAALTGRDRTEPSG